MSRRAAIACGLIAVSVMVVVAGVVDKVTDHFDPPRAVASVPDDWPTTLEQRLLVHVSERLDRLSDEMAQVKPEPAVRPVKATKPTTRTSLSKRQAKQPSHGVWSAEAERDRVAWRRWAVARLAGK